MAFNFKEVKAKFQRLKQDLPAILQNEGVRYFLKGFDQQQFDGIQWKSRIDKTNARRLLVRRGSLRRALAGSKREATFDRIRFAVNVQSTSGFNYSVVHNEGTARIPRRRFLGNSRQLDIILRNKIQTALQNCFR